MTGSTSPRRATPVRTTGRLRGASAGARTLAAVLGLSALASVPVRAEQTPWGVRIVTNNDIFANNEVKDDFYTFGLRLDLSYGSWALRWEENAFTDREAEQRFDETFLTLGTLLSAERPGGWYLWAEAGAVHVGEGFLGQGAQNDIHELTGDDKVFLDYLEDEDTYPHFEAEVGRQWRIGSSWSYGPIFGAGVSPGFRTNALAGWRTRWRPTESFGVDLILGGRYAETDLELLAPQLRRKGPAALLEIELPLHVVFEWSLNRYGTDREHFSFGFSFGSRRSLRHQTGWGEQANATP